MPYGVADDLKTLLVDLPENGSLVALVNSYIVKLEREDSTTFNVDIMNACGQNAMSEYGHTGSGETVTINGDYTCVEVDPMECLDSITNDLNTTLHDLTIQDKDVVDNIDWHDIVLYIEV